jgi:hypothetical protein
MIYIIILHLSEKQCPMSRAEDENYGACPICYENGTIHYVNKGTGYGTHLRLKHSNILFEQ